MNKMIENAAVALSQTSFGKTAKIAAGLCFIGAGSSQLVSCAGPQRTVTSSAVAGTLDGRGNFVPGGVPAAWQTKGQLLTSNHEHSYETQQAQVVAAAPIQQVKSAKSVQAVNTVEGQWYGEVQNPAQVTVVAKSASLKTDSVLTGAAQVGQFAQGVGVALTGISAVQGKLGTNVVQKNVQNAAPTTVKVGGSTLINKPTTISSAEANVEVGTPGVDGCCQ
jgi:hypothetical protein